MQFLKLFPQLYFRPITALSRMMDEGEWWPAVLAVLIVSGLLQFGLAAPLYSAFEAPLIQQEAFEETAKMFEQLRQSGGITEEVKEGGLALARPPAPTEFPILGKYGRWVFSFSISSVLTTVLALALLYVPATLLLLAQLEYLGSYDVVMQRMYGSLLVCTLSVWAAAHLPYALLGFVVMGNASLALFLWIAAKLTFGLLMICVARTVAGASLRNALLTISFSWLAMLLYGPFMAIARSLPLFWTLPIALGAWAFYSGGYGQQKSFRRSLHAATVNEHDAEAQYQLGLIYQQRRQIAEAKARFQRAVEIDPRETDAHFQLGRIAREQGRYQDAIKHFSAVVRMDEKHSLHEIWREVGATYWAAGMFNEAREALEKFVERREFDPEGLFWLGETYAKLGDHERARAFYQRSHDAAASMPYHRRRETGRWGKNAKAKLAAL